MNLSSGSGNMYYIPTTTYGAGATDWPGWTCSTTWYGGAPSQENTVAIKAKHWLVVKRGATSPTEVCDSEKEALAAAKRLAAQVGDEFLVFKPAKIVRLVPVDVEVEDV